MIQVCFCCNDECGNFAGRVTRFEIDVDGDEFTLDGSLWPPAGIALDISRLAPGDKAAAEAGVDLILTFDGTLRLTACGFAEGVGNVFWSASLLPEAELLRLLKHLMSVPTWHCTAGPCELCEYFNDRRTITEDVWRKASEATA